MHIVKIFNWIIKVNTDETKDFYANEGYISCPCDYCKNYLLCCDIFSESINNLFNELFINPKKEGEVMHFNENKDGTHFYLPFYHLSGQILSLSEFEFIKKNKNITVSELVLPNDYQVDFTDKLSLVPEDFPEPTIEFSLSLNLPWLLTN